MTAMRSAGASDARYFIAAAESVGACWPNAGFANDRNDAAKARARAGNEGRVFIGAPLLERPRAACLRAMHDAALGRIERVTSMQRAPVVPDQQVARLPPMVPRHRVADCALPQRIEQRFRFFLGN